MPLRNKSLTLGSFPSTRSVKVVVYDEGARFFLSLCPGLVHDSWVKHDWAITYVLNRRDSC